MRPKFLLLRNFFKYNINYTDEELENLVIPETRMSKNDDVINVAMADLEDVKEVYARKAESRNENIVLRSYIPPNFHARFIGLSRICTEKRAANPLLKTQLRFGKADVEVYTKLKR